MKLWKRAAAAVMTVLLVLCAMPVTALAAETQSWEMTGFAQLEEVELVRDTISNGAQNAVLGPNAVEWIDRLAELPDYALALYSWLEENSDGDGVEDALIDPTQVDKVDGMDGYYLVPVVIREDLTMSYTVDPAIGKEEFQEVANEKIMEENSDFLNQAIGESFDVFAAFCRDNPQVFWIPGECRVLPTMSWYSSTDVYGNVTLKYGLYVYFVLQESWFDIRSAEYRDPAVIRGAITERDALAAQILSGASGSRYEVVQYLNQWLTTHNCYNTSTDLVNLPADCRNCMGAMTGQVGNKGPVCEGYAKALKVLCDKRNIPCVLVDGMANNGGGAEAHMWNYVQMEDGKWYAVDTTWNDPSVYGVSGAVSGCEEESYLLVGSQTVIDGRRFGDSHRVMNQPSENSICFTNGPVLAGEKYVPGSVHVHSYAENVVKPTCTERGYTVYTCACGDSNIDNYTEATGHQEETVSGKDASCTQPGLTEGKKCSVCGTVTVEQKPVAAKGHSYDNDRDAICNVCGEERKVEQEKPQEPVKPEEPTKPEETVKPEKIETTPMYRLYNPNSGEHFYTANAAERDMLVGYGWADEGIAWYAPTKIGEPVYRLYNPNAGEHHYTISAGERDVLVSVGWKDEGIGWLTAGNNQEPVYRVYNPNEFANNHHYTRDAGERDWLVSLGWVDEGIGWFGILN